MKISNFNKGIFFASAGSFWWGFLGTYYFQYITFVGAFEVVVHRSIWTMIILLITTLVCKKINLVIKIFKNTKKIVVLSITSLLIFGNWSVWIYAVANKKIIDASIGYFIFPIISVFFGYIFFNEKLNKKRIISILIVFIATIYLFFDINAFPWVGFVVAFLWSVYNLLRKKIKVDADLGLFVESILILPIALVILYFVFQNNLNDFTFSNPILMFLLFLAGPMTVIPLFLYIKGVELSGLGPSGMIFFITPTGQFLLGFFYYNEIFSAQKLFSFVLIWSAVIIYLKDLYESN